MNLLKIKTIFLLNVLFSGLCFAVDVDSYWDAYVTKKQSNPNYDLVQHVKSLIDLTHPLEKKEEHANAIIYFISTGGKYGFRSAPATAEEEEILKNALHFAGRVKKDSVNFLETYQKHRELKYQQGVSQTNADYDSQRIDILECTHRMYNLSTSRYAVIGGNVKQHFEAAQRLFSEANKPLYVFFPEEGTNLSFVNSMDKLKPADSSVLFDQLHFSEASISNKEIRNTQSQESLAGVDINTAAGFADVQIKSDSYCGDLLKMPEVKNFVRQIEQKIDGRHPNKVAFIGDNSFFASVVASLVSQDLKTRFGFLLLYKSPALWPLKNSFFPASIIMRQPDTYDTALLRTCSLSFDYISKLAS